MRNRARERIEEVKEREQSESKSESNREIVPDVQRGSEERPRKLEVKLACARASEIQEVADRACGPARARAQASVGRAVCVFLR
jgi:hypothetical protein